MFWHYYSVILGTLYYFGFWKNANCPQLEMIDVAVVAEEDSPFLTFLEGAEDLLSLHVMKKRRQKKHWKMERCKEFIRREGNGH